MTCDPTTLVTESKCFWCLGSLEDAVSLYLLCTIANGGEIEIPKRVLGDPEAPFIFGDPTTGVVFGIP